MWFFERTLLDGVCIALLLAAVLLISLQVLNRYLLHLPYPWTEEFTRYFFVWLCLLGSARGVRDNAHIKVDIFVNMFPPRVQKVFDLAIGIITIVLMAALLISGLEILPPTFHRRAATVNISLSYVFVAVPLSAFLMLVFAVRNTFGFSKGDSHLSMPVDIPGRPCPTRKVDHLEKEGDL